MYGLCMKRSELRTCATHMHYGISVEFIDVSDLVELPPSLRNSPRFRKMLELVVIGAGPHALTLVCRLLEQTTDSSVDQPWREARSRTDLLGVFKTARANNKTQQTVFAPAFNSQVAIIDTSGEWMHRWDEQFSGLHIPHLRSPISVHPDPVSTWGLELWADAKHRNSEMVEMKVIGRSQDFRGPFWLPGSSLFMDYCNALVERYGLQGAVRKGRAVAVDTVQPQAPESPEGPSHFKVTLDDGTQLEARRVVVAIGSTNLPRVPCWAQHLTPAKQQPGMLPRGFVLHSWDVARAFYSRAQSSIKPNYEQAQAHNTSLKRAARSRPSKATPPLVLSRCADGVCAHSGSLGLCGVATLPLQMPSSGRAVDSSNKGNAINSCLDCGDTRCVGECDTERVPEPPGWIDATGLEALSLGGHTGITQPTASHHQPGSTDGACMMHVGASSGGESAALPPRITMPPSSICGQQAGGQAPGSAGSLGCGLTSPTSPHPETDEDFVEPCSPQPLCLSPNCASLAGTRVVVVGGGLTASQLALLAVRHGCQDCVVIVRGELKVQQFDIGVQWLGRNRGGLLTEMDVAAGDCAKARLATLKSAGGGKGSMTPEAIKLMLPHIKAGTIRIVVHEEVMAADWDDAYCWGCDAPGNRPHAAGSPGQGSPSAVQGKTCMTQGSAFTKNDEPSADHSRSSGQDRHVARPPCDDVHTWGGWGLHLCGCGRVLAPGEVMAALRKAARDQGAEAGDSTDDEDDMLGAGAGTPVVKEEQGHSPDTHPHSHLHDHSHQHTPQRHEQAVRGSGGKGGGVACSSCQTASDRELTDAEGVLWAHHVWLATGSVVDCSKDPLMSSLTKTVGAPAGGVVNGLPMLTPDLRWQEGQDLFVMGAYAALRLGPGALNLMGARTGARIVEGALCAPSEPLSGTANPVARANCVRAQLGGMPRQKGDSCQEWVLQLRASLEASRVGTKGRSRCSFKAQKAGGFKR